MWIRLVGGGGGKGTCSGSEMGGGLAAGMARRPGWLEQSESGL